MSVIVRGMEMPALCQECNLYIEGACYAKGYRDYRSIMDMSKPDDCPLIEVPDSAIAISKGFDHCDFDGI